MPALRDMLCQEILAQLPAVHAAPLPEPASGSQGTAAWYEAQAWWLQRELGCEAGPHLAGGLVVALQSVILHNWRYCTTNQKRIGPVHAWGLQTQGRPLGCQRRRAYLAGKHATQRRSAARPALLVLRSRFPRPTTHACAVQVQRTASLPRCCRCGCPHWQLAAWSWGHRAGMAPSCRCAQEALSHLSSLSLSVGRHCITVAAFAAGGTAGAHRLTTAHRTFHPRPPILSIPFLHPRTQQTQTPNPNSVPSSSLPARHRRPSRSSSSCSMRPPSKPSLVPPCCPSMVLWPRATSPTL